MVCRRLPLPKALQAGTVDQKYVLASVIVIIEERHARPVRFDDVLLRLLISGSETHAQTGIQRHVRECYGKWPARWSRAWRGRRIVGHGALGGRKYPRRQPQYPAHVFHEHDCSIRPPAHASQFRRDFHVSVSDNGMDLTPY